MTVAKQDAVCEVSYVDEKKVRRVERQILAQPQVQNIVRIFEALADETRFKILLALSKEELCVHDLSGLLRSTVSAVSHHLRILRDLRLVNTRREGQMIYYSLSDEHVAKLVSMGVQHERET